MAEKRLIHGVGRSKRGGTNDEGGGAAGSGAGDSGMVRWAGKRREEEREIEEEDGVSKRDNGVDILCHVSSDEWAILVIITINLKAFGDLGFLKQPTTRLVGF